MVHNTFLTVQPASTDRQRQRAHTGGPAAHDVTTHGLRDVDLRGKTIRNVSTATGYAMLGEMGVQKFTTALTIDGGEPFYIVDSSFGWFIPEVFENQVTGPPARLYSRGA